MILKESDLGTRLLTVLPADAGLILKNQMVSLAVMDVLPADAGLIPPHLSYWKSFGYCITRGRGFDSIHGFSTDFDVFCITRGRGFDSVDLRIPGR